MNKIFKKAFTLTCFCIGLNDPSVASSKTPKYFSYLKNFNHIKSWVLVDVGAHTGTFTNRASKLLNISEIILLEPNTEHLSTLKNKFPSATVIGAAVSLNAGQAYYVRNTKNSGQNFISKTIVSNEEVETITINSLFSKIQYTNAAILLKIDIEGNELTILQDLSKVYFNKICLMVVEINPTLDTLNFFDDLCKFIPDNFLFYRETRYGMISVSREKPHWSDRLNLFQNFLLVNKDLVKS
jgi:FkbM family methyltransferase